MGEAPMTSEIVGFQTQPGDGHWHLTWHGIKAKYVRRIGAFPFGGKNLGIVWCNLRHDHPMPATAHYWES